MQATNSHKNIVRVKKKLNQTENELKTKERQLEAMKKLNDKLQKLIKQTEEDHKKVIEKHQIQIKGVKSSSQQLQDHGRKYRAEIGELKQKINQLNIQVQKRSTMINLQSVRKLQAVTQYKSTQILQLTNKKIEQQNEQLKKQLSQKQKAFHILSNQLQTLSDERNQIEKTHEEKLKTLENKKNLIEKHYEGLNLGLKKELEIMKIKHSKVEDNHQQFQSLKSNNLSMKNLNSFKSNLSHNSQLSVLDSELSLALESKTLELSNLRKILGDKVEEIYLLQQKLQDVSIRENSLFTEIDFLKKKLSACEKNSKMTNEIELSTLKGELESVQRKKETLQSKLATKIKEVKLKDEFIANSIIGKIKSQQDSSLVLAEIQRIFENDYLIKLRQADDKVKQLECKLQIKG